MGTLNDWQRVNHHSREVGWEESAKVQRNGGIKGSSRQYKLWGKAEEAEGKDDRG